MKEPFPKNWANAKFTDILSIKGGSQPPKSEFVDEPREGFIRLLQIRDFGAKPVPTYIPVVGNQLLCSKEDILIARYGASIGRIVFGMEGTYNVALAKVIIPNLISRGYVKMYLRSNIFQIPITSIQRTAQNGFNKEDLKELEFPLPPFKEQERIVIKLDTLFSQVEVMKKALEHIPKLLKDFRNQVLAHAVSGKLTEDWRKTPPIDFISPISIGSNSNLHPENWNWCKLTNLARLESGHTPRKSREDYWINGDVFWISLQDIRKAHGTIINDTIFKPNQIGIDNSSARLLPPGTVCFCRDISVGYVTIMGKSMATSQHFANWICSDSLSNKFLMYAFMAAKDSLIASGTGTTVATIYMPALKEFHILAPPLIEQEEIAARIESLFAKADKIEEKYKALKNKIENLPPAILHKAFKGELVEQLPTDGDAKDLLAEIKKLKVK